MGAAATIHATVTCASSALTNGNIQIYILDPNGNQAALQNYSGQNFKAQQSQSFSMTFTPAMAGVYSLEVGVFSATWQQWNWNWQAGSLTVTPPVAFTSTATAPVTMVAGATAAISVTVTETGLSGLANANVELQVFNSSGAAVATQFWSSQNFAKGQSRSYSYNWTSAATLPAGSYSVDVGVFDSAWSHDYYWNTDASIAVTAPKPAVSLSVSALSFASQTVGASSGAQSATLTNSSTATLTIAAITLGGSNPGDFAQTNTCGASLAAGAHCAISVTFKPTAAGARTAAVAISSNAAGSPQTIALSGTGVAATSKAHWCTAGLAAGPRRTPTAYSAKRQSGNQILPPATAVDRPEGGLTTHRRLTACPTGSRLVYCQL